MEYTLLKFVHVRGTQLGLATSAFVVAIVFLMVVKPTLG